MTQAASDTRDSDVIGIVNVVDLLVSQVAAMCLGDAGFVALLRTGARLPL